MALSSGFRRYLHLCKINVLKRGSCPKGKASFRKAALPWFRMYLFSPPLLSLQERPEAPSEAGHGVSLVFFTTANFHIKRKDGPVQGLTPFTQPWSSLKCKLRKHSFPRWPREPHRCGMDSFQWPLGPSQLRQPCHLKCLYFIFLFLTTLFPHTEKLPFLF